MKRAEIDSKEAENKEHHASSDPMTGLALLAIEARLAAMAEIILAFAEMAGEDA